MVIGAWHRFGGLTLGEGDSERLRRATAEIQSIADSQADRLQRLGESLIRL